MKMISALRCFLPTAQTWSNAGVTDSVSDTESASEIATTGYLLYLHYLFVIISNELLIK